MAATLLPPGSGGSYLESPTYSHTRTKPLSAGFDRRNANPTRTALSFDISELEEDVHTSYSLASKLSTPDSGFFGAVSSTPLKTPESEFSSSAITPPPSGSGPRKRKTVTIDESQSSIVVISPDDLFNTYSKSQVQSLESRDNPFLPGGDLSREVEALLSSATIIRHHFYLNDEEKRQLQEHQQQQQQQQQQQDEGKQHRAAKHVHISEHPDEIVAHPNDADDVSDTHEHYESSPSPFVDNIEERISPHSQANNLAAAAPASSLNGGGSHQPRENGKLMNTTASSDSDKLAIPDGDRQSQAPGETDRFGAGDVPAPTSATPELQIHEPDKKRRNKCCTIM